MITGTGELPDQLRKVLDSIPASIFLVDRDVRILECNSAARTLIHEERCFTPRRLCGDVLRCVHARSAPGGCGTSAVCPDCVLRNAVTAAAGGSIVMRKQTRMTLARNDETHDVFFLVTVHPLEVEGRPLALMTLEDVTEVVELQGMLPICANCKRVRDEHDFWEQIESYLHRRSKLEFTHSICPDCMKKLYPTSGDKRV
jgi:PAS domain-containing protein